MTRTGDWWEDRHSKPPTGRFTNFTPLTAPIDQVLMQIKDDTTLTWSGKLKGDPNKRSKDKYFHFHQDHVHDTFECYDLNQQIQALIRQGKLQRFISKEMVDSLQEQVARKDNKYPKPLIRDIRMIVRDNTLQVHPRRPVRLTLGWFKTYNWQASSQKRRESITL